MLLLGTILMVEGPLMKMLEYGIYAFLFLGFLSGYRAGFLAQVFVILAMLLLLEMLPYVNCSVSVALSSVMVDKHYKFFPLIAFTLSLGIVFYTILTMREFTKYLLQNTYVYYLDGLIGGMVGLAGTVFSLGSFLTILKRMGYIITVDNEFYEQMVEVADEYCPRWLLEMLEEKMTKLIELVKSFREHIFRKP